MKNRRFGVHAMNADQNVKVSIRSVQFPPVGEAVRSEIHADGILRAKDGRRFLLWSETDEDGSLTRSLAKFSEDSVQLIRNGQISSNFTFDLRQRCRCSYSAPFTSFIVDIDTERYEMAETDSRISLSIGYRLYIEGEFTARCAIDLEISQAGEYGRSATSIPVNG